jgi:hypothetical protein
LSSGALLTKPARAAADFQMLTSKENSTIAEDTVVLLLRGNIDQRAATDLSDIWSSVSTTYKRLILDIDSPGGILSETERVVAVIADIRRTVRVDTLVRHGAMCASACVAIFVQGEERLAGGASAWMFHGACYAHSNIPSLSLTDRFLDLLRNAGVSDRFLCSLVEEGYLTNPGKLWLSGYELFHVYQANVITELLEPWRPEAAYSWPADPLIGPH